MREGDQLAGFPSEKTKLYPEIWGKSADLFGDSIFKWVSLLCYLILLFHFYGLGLFRVSYIFFLIINKSIFELKKRMSFTSNPIHF